MGGGAPDVLDKTNARKKIQPCESGAGKPTCALPGAPKRERKQERERERERERAKLPQAPCGKGAERGVRGLYSFAK